MNCERCDDLLIDYVGGELEAGPRVEVARHLAGCERCALAFCRLRADLDGVLQATAMSPPPGLRARLRAEAERSFRPPWWRRALAPLRAPVPAYGLAIASLVPLLTIAAVRLWLPAADDAVGARPLRISDYDASAPIVRPLNFL